ncbi:MAG: ABC transporter ATP-binding protein [Anaerolineae bacterium]|nr:ABC transporter ATP-binding protein [Anaerolineae bacterium]
MRPTVSAELVLQVNDLRVHYPTPRGTVRAVDGVSFAVRQGERFGLIGESGSGKSTIALALMRLIKPPGQIISGEAWLLTGAQLESPSSEGGERESRVNLLTLPEEQMRQLRLSQIALVTQGAMNSLNPVMRVQDQIVDGLRAHDVRLSPAEEQQRVSELLESVDLRPDVAHHFPHELSGGMKQRVCIAIAISLRPKLIIADEPTSALDVIVQRRVMQTLRKVQESLGAAIILIGHDMGLMAQFVHRMGVMRAGQMLDVGDVREMFARPAHPYTRLLMESLPSFEKRAAFRKSSRLEQTVGADS